MKALSLIDGTNTVQYPAGLKKAVQRVVKVVILHIDGHTDEMKLTFPIWTHWSEPGEIASYCLSQFVFQLSNAFIVPERFEIFIGSINDEGEEQYSGFGFKYEIPIDRVFVPTKGKWVDPGKERQK